MQKIYILCISLFSFYGFSQNKLDVFFDFNQDVPNEASQIKINQWILDNKTAEITKVLGYCDSVDDSKYNKDLALRRVNSMVTIFANNNIKISDKVELKAFGKDFKHSKNQSENRKVEVFYNLTAAKKKVSVDVEDDYQFNELSVLVDEEKSGLASKFDKAKKEDLIRINNINFYFNSEKVMEKSTPLLDKLLQIMLDNQKLKIEIHGHICCNPNPMDTKLSYRRAIVIFKYLINHGIPVKRLDYQGFGSNNPIYPIPEENEQQRAANRRVEILILDK